MQFGDKTWQWNISDKEGCYYENRQRMICLFIAMRVFQEINIRRGSRRLGWWRSPDFHCHVQTLKPKSALCEMAMFHDCSVFPVQILVIDSYSSKTGGKILVSSKDIRISYSYSHSYSHSYSYSYSYSWDTHIDSPLKPLEWSQPQPQAVCSLPLGDGAGIWWAEKFGDDASWKLIWTSK